MRPQPGAAVVDVAHVQLVNAREDHILPHNTTRHVKSLQVRRQTRRGARSMLHELHVAAAVGVAMPRGDPEWAVLDEENGSHDAEGSLVERHKAIMHGAAVVWSIPASAPWQQ